MAKARGDVIFVRIRVRHIIIIIIIRRPCIVTHMVLLGDRMGAWMVAERAATRRGRGRRKKKKTLSVVLGNLSLDWGKSTRKTKITQITFRIAKTLILVHALISVFVESSSRRTRVPRTFQVMCLFDYNMLIAVRIRVKILFKLFKICLYF